MIEEQEMDLLLDLLKLLKKHGDKTFSSLANKLTSGEVIGNLSQILMQVSKRAEKMPRPEKERKGKQQHPIPKSLSTLEKIDPQKYGILIEFHRDLVAKRVLPSFRDIKQFATDCDLPEIYANSRQKVINPLIEALVVSPNEMVHEWIKSAKSGQQTDRSLEGWGKIIMKKKQGE